MSSNEGVVEKDFELLRSIKSTQWAIKYLDRIEKDFKCPMRNGDGGWKSTSLYTLGDNELNPASGTVPSDPKQ